MSRAAYAQQRRKVKAWRDHGDVRVFVVRRNRTTGALLACAAGGEAFIDKGAMVRLEPPNGHAEKADLEVKGPRR